MAVTDWGRLTSITRTKVMPFVVNQVSEDYPLLKRFLTKGEKKSGGSRIEQPITYKYKTQGGWYSGIEVLNTALENTRTRAYWDWKQLYEPLVFDNMEIFKNSGGEDIKIVDLMKQEAQEVRESLRNNFATSLYSDGTGDDNKELTGLDAAIDDGTNVTIYGGITIGNYSWWAAQYTAVSAAISWAAVATMYDSCASGTDAPSIGVTTPAIWTDFEALLEPNVRYNFQANGYPKFDGGIQDAVLFRGMKIISDEYCTSGEMNFINDRYMKFVIASKHPKYATDANGFTTTDLKEPSDQDGQVGFLLWWGNLTNSRPNRNGRLVSIS